MQTSSKDNRVLILAPTGLDAAVLCRALSAATIPAEECTTPGELCERLAEGAGAAIVAEEALSSEARGVLATVLAGQPPWSELPLIVMGMQDGRLGPGRQLLDEVKGTASAILLQRPIHTVVLLSVVRAGLQSRARQYQIRDELLRRSETELALRESERRLRELNDTLEQRVAERTGELENRARQLRRLAHELTRAEHRERKKLAQTLHDGLQQILIAIKMQLAAHSGRDRPDVPDRVNELLDQTIDISKSLVYELSPPILHDAELPEALDWLARWFSENHRFTVHLETAGDLPIVQEGTKLFLFHAIRELLLNAVKHSGARTATVLSRSDGPRRIQFEVRDQGAGFDPATVSEVDFKGFGLFSIQERLRALGGHLDVASCPGGGARFVLNVPLMELGAPGDQAEPAAHTRVRVSGRREARRTRRVRVVVVDDHRIFREGLVSMLRNQNDLEIIGEAADGWEGVHKADQLHPDVVVMDINLPGLNGIESTRRIKQAHPEIQVIGLSMHQDRQRENALLQAGASVYLRKIDAAKTLFQTIRDLSSKRARGDSRIVL